MSAAVPQTCVQPPSGLIGWWPGDGSFADIIGGQDGSNAGGATFTAGMVGQAFQFTGASDSFIVLPDNPNLIPASSAFTLAAWIKPDFTAANQVDDILYKRDGCDQASQSYAFMVLKEGVQPFGAYPRELYFAMTTTGNQVVELGSGGASVPGPEVITDDGTRRVVHAGKAFVPDDNQFHHVAATFDGLVMRLYLDGQIVGETERPGPIAPATSPAVIGAHGGTCPQRTVAAIDEVQIHRRALSDSEIAALYNAGSAGVCKGFTFSGLFPPVSNPPVLNVVNAGRAIPVKFSLDGDQGLSIFAPGYPASQQVSCTTFTADPQNTIDETVTAGGSSLSYDASTDEYTYVWKTNNRWAGTCRRLIVRLIDDSNHEANFQFK